MTQRSLQREGLARALTEVTLAVQRARRVEEAIAVASGGLEAMGFDVAIVGHVKGRYAISYLTRRPGLDELSSAVAAQLKAFDGSTSGWLPQVLQSDQGVYVEGLQSATHQWLVAVDAPPPMLAVAEREVRKRAIIAPLSVRPASWRAAILMHDDLAESDLPLLNLFALQLGSSLVVVDGLERLERRTAELELVHQLAVSSTRSDVREQCQAALEVVCHSTGSDAGTLHRVEREPRQIVRVGDCYGSPREVVAAFPAGELLERATGPASLEVAALSVGGAPLAAEGFHHVGFVPLALEGEQVGVLSLFRRADRPFSDADLHSAEILGLQMASLLERQRLYQESQRLYADLKKSYDELARAQAEVVRHERLAALGELAAVMAHEVRNPLGVIFNSLTTLKRLTKPTGDAEMLLNMVGEEADRLNRIVADLLDFARPYELVKKPIAVEPFITGAIDAAMQALTPSVPVQVVTSFERELPPFPLDPHLMRQALINLVMNAAQAMPRGGVVTVSAAIEVRGGVPWLRIEVRDEGLGLTARASEKMFQPFFTTKATGTGLGLAVVKRIVDSHGGEVSARPNPDKGTTFELRVPGGSEREAGGLTPPRPSPAAARR